MKVKFPKYLFLRALVLQLIVLILGFLIYNWVSPISDLAFHNKIFAFIFFALLSVINLSIILSYILHPLMQIIANLNYMVSNQVFNEGYLSQISAYDNSPGEWHDLELIIKKLVKVIRKNFKALSREKIEIQAVMNSVEDPIFAIDQNERLVFYNPAFGMTFGIESKSGDELLAHHILSDANLIQLLRKVLKDGEVDEQMVNIKIGGQNYVFAVSVSPLKRETDLSTYGVVAVFRDRTQQIEINKKRLDFVANASHELRTPITMISSAVSVLQNNITKPELIKDLALTLKENSQRLNDLTESMLDLSSLESGEVLDLKSINCWSFTQEALRINSFEKERIKIKCDESLNVMADKKRLLQVLTNLISNALRYSPEGTMIQISWDLDKKEDCILSVKDQGPGIPEDLKSRIFERFYRIDESRSRKLGGIGIGLSIVNHIMKLHKGEIYVNQDYQDGADFVCTFSNKI